MSKPVHSMGELLTSLFSYGRIPSSFQNEIDSRRGLGEFTENSRDEFAMHEILDQVNCDGRCVELTVKSYYMAGSYVGNAVALLTPFRLTSALRKMYQLRASACLHFESIDLYAGSNLEEGALVFDEKFVMKYSIGRKKRAGNYYVDTLENDHSIVDGKVTKLGAAFMVGKIFQRLPVDDLALHFASTAMKKLIQHIHH